MQNAAKRQRIVAEYPFSRGRAHSPENELILKRLNSFCFFSLWRMSSLGGEEGEVTEGTNAQEPKSDIKFQFSILHNTYTYTSYLSSEASLSGVDARGPATAQRWASLRGGNRYGAGASPLSKSRSVS